MSYVISLFTSFYGYIKGKGKREKKHKNEEEKKQEYYYTTQVYTLDLRPALHDILEYLTLYKA
jgi:hypothetical protein